MNGGANRASIAQNKARPSTRPTNNGTASGKNNLPKDVLAKRPDKDLVAALVKMDFPQDLVVKALVKTEGDFGGAYAILVNVKTLVEMGFPRGIAYEALAETKGDLERAITLLTE